MTPDVGSADNGMIAVSVTAVITGPVTIAISRDLKEALSDYRKAARSTDPSFAKEANAGIERVTSKIAHADKARPEELTLRLSGSGFVVNNQGYILTNYHVVEGCAKLRLKGSTGVGNAAESFATDETNDLAVLRPAIGAAALPFKDGRGVRQADQIISVGFPLAGLGLVSTSAKVSTGTVSALAGPNDDSRLLQISAPTQPGNSGGPVLDISGNVVGITVATLNAAKMLKLADVIPQNINFAIKSNIAREFLDTKGVSYETASSSNKLDLGDVAAKGVRSTVLIECYK
jgi:S1-C subfamily serine protease